MPDNIITGAKNKSVTCLLNLCCLRSFVRSDGPFFLVFGVRTERRLDPSGADTTWVSTSNTTLTFEGLQDGDHILTVRARETLEAGGSTDKVGWGGVGWDGVQS